jgi:hypothetical protein
MSTSHVVAGSWLNRDEKQIHRELEALGYRVNRDPPPDPPKHRPTFTTQPGCIALRRALKPGAAFHTSDQEAACRGSSQG